MITSTHPGEELLRVVMMGHIHFQSLWAGIELSIFEMLAANGPMDLETLQKKTELADHPIKMVMANLCALGFVELRGKQYQNTDVAKEFLLKDSPKSIVAVMGWQARIVWPGIEDYVRSLRENTNVGLERFKGEGNLYQRLAQNPELEKVFQDAMAGMQSNQYVAKSLDLARYRHLCDCGGGAGRNALEIATRNPTLKVTIFDQPTVCDRAQENIAARGLTDRVTTHKGNFLTDPFPAGIDCVLYAHISTIWSEANNTKIFTNAYKALPEGGSFMIYTAVANDQHTGPIYVTPGSVYFHALATGEGFMYSAADYEKMLRAAGFGKVTVNDDLPLAHAVITATK
jgi:hypothetical protein